MFNVVPFSSDETLIPSRSLATIPRPSTRLLKEEALLNAKLAELEKEGDDKRSEDVREEAATRPAGAHGRLSDVDAENGSSLAAGLLA